MELFGDSYFILAFNLIFFLSRFRLLLTILVPFLGGGSEALFVSRAVLTYVLIYGVFRCKEFALILWRFLGCFLLMGLIIISGFESSIISYGPFQTLSSTSLLSGVGGEEICVFLEF